MKYNVTYKIDARYATEVEANSIEEAKKMLKETSGMLNLEMHMILTVNKL